MQTTTALLDGLRDASDHATWQEFDDRFRPIIVGFARHLGLSSADAADVAQETLLRFLQEYRAGRYERSRGRLGAYIVTLTRSRIADHRRRVARRRQWRGDSAFADLPGEDALLEVWDRECRRYVLQRALAELKARSKIQPRTLQAFEWIAYEGREPTWVAEQLGMTVDEVYVAKHRTLERLRSHIDEVTRALALED